VEAGADIVTFSGDKLLGGPQAGVAVGRATAIEAMRSHPLARALRIDKLDLAALDVVLRMYLDPAAAVERVPTLAMITAPVEVVRARAERLRELLTGAPDGPFVLAAERVAVVETEARAGAGALPVMDVPSAGVTVEVPAGAADRLAAALRGGLPAVVCRVHDERLLFDVRAVTDEEIEELAIVILLVVADQPR
jgi:L-seryl-tRNA(Ser) seleniumtransferase